jgi:hypothetical protein
MPYPGRDEAVATAPDPLLVGAAPRRAPAAAPEDA